LKLFNIKYKKSFIENIMKIIITIRGAGLLFIMQLLLFLFGENSIDWLKTLKYNITEGFLHRSVALSTCLIKLDPVLLRKFEAFLGLHLSTINNYKCYNYNDNVNNNGNYNGNNNGNNNGNDNNDNNNNNNI
jgi:hypothetical protein